MTITFYNVAITMEAESARQAYDDLCELLDAYNAKCESGIEWDTDTYAVGDGEPRSTSELWPE